MAIVCCATVHEQQGENNSCSWGDYSVICGNLHAKSVERNNSHWTFDSKWHFTLFALYECEWMFGGGRGRQPWRLCVCPRAAVATTVAHRRCKASLGSRKARHKIDPLRNAPVMVRRLSWGYLRVEWVLGDHWFLLWISLWTLFHFKWTPEAECRRRWNEHMLDYTHGVPVPGQVQYINTGQQPPPRHPTLHEMKKQDVGMSHRKWENTLWFMK